MPRDSHRPVQTFLVTIILILRCLIKERKLYFHDLNEAKPLPAFPLAPIVYDDSPQGPPVVMPVGREMQCWSRKK